MRTPGAPDEPRPRQSAQRLRGRSQSGTAGGRPGHHSRRRTDDRRAGPQSWAFEAKYAAPPWAGDPALWDDAFQLLRSEPPHYQPCFIHRDFQPRNVLWSEGRVSGVVDWVETSIGPAWLDVAHCCTAIAISHGTEPADAFAAAYVARTGRDPQPYFDVMDVIGHLPLPGRDGLIQEPEEQSRLEQRLRVVLQRLDRRT